MKSRTKRRIGWLLGSVTASIAVPALLLPFHGDGRRRATSQALTGVMMSMQEIEQYYDDPDYTGVQDAAYLVALMRDGKDGWGRQIHFVSDAERSCVRIVSGGKDGVFGNYGDIEKKFYIYNPTFEDKIFGIIKSNGDLVQFLKNSLPHPGKA